MNQYAWNEMKFHWEAEYPNTFFTIISFISYFGY